MLNLLMLTLLMLTLLVLTLLVLTLLVLTLLVLTLLARCPHTQVHDAQDSGELRRAAVAVGAADVAAASVPRRSRL